MGDYKSFFRIENLLTEFFQAQAIKVNHFSGMFLFTNFKLA